MDHEIGEADGAIVQVGNIADGITARAAWRKHGTPVVLLYGGRLRNGPPQVGVDDIAIGRMAAEHFLDRGFEHFSYMPLDFAHSRGPSSGRYTGFRLGLADRGFSPSRFSICTHYPPVDMGSRVTGLLSQIVPWLAALPKPVAIFASDDFRAKWVVNSAALLDLDMPEEIAILGVNNDEVRCLAAWPPLSSIRLPARLVGTLAAEQLSRMLAGKEPSAEPILLAPEGVEVRQSTDTTAVSDSRVAAAVRYIRDHACDEDFTLEAVAEHAALSEGHLFRLFRQYLKHTPLAEIRRVQLDNAKRLLVQTDRNIDQIARECGLCRGSYLSQELKKATNLSPRSYRKQFRRT